MARIQARACCCLTITPVNRPLCADCVSLSGSITTQKILEECTSLVLAREQKANVITQYQAPEKDTGSPEVQMATLSARIGQWTKHFKPHGKAHAPRRGLLMMVSRRRRLLDYL